LERPQAHTSEGFKHVLNIKNLYIEKKKKNWKSRISAKKSTSSVCVPYVWFW
jgi:hypothetical protein